MLGTQCGVENEETNHQKSPSREENGCKKKARRGREITVWLNEGRSWGKGWCICVHEKSRGGRSENTLQKKAPWSGKGTSVNVVRGAALKETKEQR